MLLNFLYEIRKVSNRLLAKILHCIEAEHAVTLELRFGEKLIGGALVRECFAPLKVFVNVAWFFAVTRRFDVNENAVRSLLSVRVPVQFRIADATNGTGVAFLAGTFQRVNLAARIDAHPIEFDRNS